MFDHNNVFFKMKINKIFLNNNEENALKSTCLQLTTFIQISHFPAKSMTKKRGILKLSQQNKN